MSWMERYASLYPNYQRGAEQQGAIWSKVVEQLGQMASQSAMMNEAQQAAAPQSWEASSPAQTVKTDLLGKPITQNVATMPQNGSSNMQRPTAVPAPVQLSGTEGSGTFDPTTSVPWLMKARTSQNPFLANIGKMGLENKQLMAPKYQSFAPGSMVTDDNSLSPTFGETTQVPGNAAATQDQKVGERVGPDNIKYATYKKPDNSTYEIKVGAERPPASSSMGQIAPEDAFDKWDVKTKQYWFETANSTGKEPDFGRGVAATKSKTQFSKQIAEYNIANGLSGQNVGGNVATFKSDQKSLDAMTKSMDSIMTFESGVDKSLNLVTALSDKMSRGQIPGINKLSQFAQYQGGNPDIKAFKNALTTAMTEYMKVTTAGMGLSSQELTVQAQARAKELLDTSDNAETFANSINLMRQEMTIKKNAFTERRGLIQSRLRGGNTPATGGKRTKELKDMTDQELIDYEKSLNGGK